MELPETTLELLRDEAYVFLCRDALRGKLGELEHEKAQIESTRPPFRVLARRETCDAFDRSLRLAVDTEEAVRERLAQLTRLDQWLQPRLLREIAEYLHHASADYQRFSEIHELLCTWHSAVGALPELLVAFAREVRGFREAAAKAGATDGDQTECLVLLHDVATRVEEQQATLAALQAQLHALTHVNPVLAREIRLPALPNLQRVAWVGRIALLPLAQAAEEARHVEAELRAFALSGVTALAARIEASKTACQLHAQSYLQAYWNQLRTHAQVHYVEEREIDEILEDLGQRYVRANILERQKALTRDPFLAER